MIYRGISGKAPGGVGLFFLLASFEVKNPRSLNYGHLRIQRANSPIYIAQSICVRDLGRCRVKKVWLMQYYSTYLNKGNSFIVRKDGKVIKMCTLCLKSKRFTREKLMIVGILIWLILIQKKKKPSIEINFLGLPRK